MGAIDPVKERQRLATLYAGVSDLELEKVGKNPYSLTEWAQGALIEELRKRGLEWKTDPIEIMPIPEDEILVTAREYAERSGALFDRELLGHVGIKAFVYKEEGTATVESAPAENAEPIRLLVHKKDSEAAQRQLAQKDELEKAIRQENTEALGWSSKPVVVRQYRDVTAAMVGKTELDSAGIECVLYDDNLVRLDWFYSNAIGGVKLVVQENDKEQAESVLGQNTVEKFEVDGVGEYSQEHCPKCNSTDVSYDELRRVVVGVGLFFGLPIPARRRGWTCHVCGNRWDVAQQGKAEKVG